MNIRIKGAALMHAGRHDKVNSRFALLIRTSLEIFNNMLVQFDIASHSTVKHPSPWCSSVCSTMPMPFCDACAMPSCATLPWSCFHGLYLRQVSQWEAGSVGGVASRRQISCVCGLSVNTLRTGLLNCLNARSRGLNFRHRASCI